MRAKKQKLGSKVLVTGAAGFIGSHLAERLRSLGLEVVGIDNFSNGSMKNLSALSGDRRFRLVRGDILNPKELLGACRGVDSVIHLAAQSSVAKSTEDPMGDFELNVVGTLNVLECARKADIGTVLSASSSTVYGNAALPTPEDHPLMPISNYGASKAAAEVYCRSYSSLYGLKTASFRYYNIFGPRSRKGVMFDFLQKLRKDRHILEVLGTGDQEKDYIYIDDAVGATLLVASKGKLTGDAYNVGSGEAYTVKELAKRMLKILGLHKTKLLCAGGLSWPGDVQKTHANVRKLKKLGFAPTVRFDRGLRAFIDWYQSECGRVTKK